MPSVQEVSTGIQEERHTLWLSAAVLSLLTQQLLHGFFLLTGFSLIFYIYLEIIVIIGMSHTKNQ